MRALGIDVNHFHPVTSWSSLLGARFADGSRVSFFGMKATQGTSVVDPTFKQHQAGFRQNALSSASQLLMGQYYHYFGGGDPRSEALHFRDVVGPLMPHERLVLDVEGDIPPPFEKVKEFVLYLPEEVVPFVYTSDRIWQAMGNPAWPSATVGKVELWAPRYESGAEEPVVPHPWSFWRCWQFSETFTCPGVQGPCDASWFNGTEDDLAKFAQGA